MWKVHKHKLRTSKGTLNQDRTSEIKREGEREREREREREGEREREPLFQKDVGEGPLISSIESSLDNNLSTIVVKNSAQASGLGHFYESKCKKIIRSANLAMWKPQNTC